MTVAGVRRHLTAAACHTMPRLCRLAPSWRGTNTRARAGAGAAALRAMGRIVKAPPVARGQGEMLLLVSTRPRGSAARESGWAVEWEWAVLLPALPTGGRGRGARHPATDPPTHGDFDLHGEKRPGGGRH